MFGFDLTPLFIAAGGAVAGMVGLVAAVIAGIWIDLPSWSYLAAFAVPALVAGALVHFWDC